MRDLVQLLIHRVARSNAALSVFRCAPGQGAEILCHTEGLLVNGNDPSTAAFLQRDK